MDKQEEIREGMENSIRDIGYYLGWQEDATEAVLKYLHSQGVVIKVDKELPNAPVPCPEPIPNDTYYYRGYEQAKVDMAGYVATEPLIEEVK